MSGPSDESAAAEEKSLRAALQQEIPLGDQKAWDIPIEQGAMQAGVITRPDARNNPLTEMWARLLSAVTALMLICVLLILVLFTDMDSLSRAFGDSGTMTISGLVMVAGLFALAAILLVLGLHLPARLFIRSNVPARTMELPQRALLEMLPSPVFFLNHEALIEDFNSAFATAMGQSAATMVGKSFYDFIPKEHQEDLHQGFLKAISGENNEIRCPMITRTGTRIFLIQAQGYKGHNSDEAHVIALARDISHHVEREDAQKNKYEALRLATFQTIEAIANVVELRDPYLRGHHNRVGEVSRSIAEQLDLPEGDVVGIEMAARIHDLGELYVPFEILIKPGELGDAESQIIRQHCRSGHDILAKIDFPWPIAVMVLQHHECFDGSGYPSGLRGNNISIGARIIAVADSYDAMISDRPFRAAISRTEALQRITTASGKQYDPSVVSALFKIVQSS